MEGRPADEQRLVARARTGDVNAYEEIVQRYSNLAFRVAYLITGSAEEAEEAAQDAFVKAHRALDRFDDRRPLRPWLLQIVSNEARNRRRSATRRARLELRLAEGLDRGGAAPSPEAEAEAAEERRALLRSLNAMDEDDRLLIAYRYFLDLSGAEIAHALGIARGTVKSRLSRALGRLRAQIEAAGG